MIPDDSINAAGGATLTAIHGQKKLAGSCVSDASSISEKTNIQRFSLHHLQLSQHLSVFLKSDRFI